MGETRSRPGISLVIPVYNERDNLALLHSELAGVMASVGDACEILFVDDGSTDGSDRVLRDLRASDPRVRVLTLARNSGQSAAMDAGFKSAAGEVVVTLDADLQNDPADIPRLLEALPGWDAGVAVRQKGRDSLVRRVSSRVANYVRNRLSDETITDTGCSLKAFRRASLSRIVLYDGMHRFLPTLLKMACGRVR